MAKRTNTNIVVRFAFLCVLVFLIFSVVNMQIKISELRSSKEQLQESLQKITDTIEETTIRMNTPLTDEYIERVAREKLGYRRQGEVIFYNINLSD